MKESRKFYREKIWKVLQLENVSKVLKWVNQVSIYRPRSSAHLASSKRSSEGFFTKKSRKNTISHELQQFRTIVRSGKFISTIFVFLEHFAWLCEISFHFSALAVAKIPPGSISHICVNFSHVHAKLKNMVFQLLFSIFPISFF